MIVLNVGLMLPLSVFLYTGFIRMLPREYEEAAQVDGAGPHAHAVPRRAAAARSRSPAPSPCLTGLFCWNDFFLPLIFLSGSKNQTLPVAVYQFVGNETLSVEPHLPDGRRRARARSWSSTSSSRRRSSRASREGSAADGGVTFETASARSTPTGRGPSTSSTWPCDEGEFLVLVGPSGCGKTTALRMVAGLEEVTDGELAIGGDVVTHVEPRKRDVAMVFQNYALYPHMSVFQNMAFPLQSRSLPKREIRERGRADGGDARPDRAAAAPAAQPVGRAAAARGDGPRRRAAAAGVPDGRAALEPRREAARADARRDLAAAGASSA